MAKKHAYKSRLSLKMTKSGVSSIEMAARLRVRESAVIHHERTGIKTIRKAKEYASILGCDPLEVIG